MNKAVAQVKKGTQSLPFAADAVKNTINPFVSNIGDVDNFEDFINTRYQSLWIWNHITQRQLVHTRERRYNIKRSSVEAVIAMLYEAFAIGSASAGAFNENGLFAGWKGIVTDVGDIISVSAQRYSIGGSVGINIWAANEIQATCLFTRVDELMLRSGHMLEEDILLGIHWMVATPSGTRTVYVTSPVANTLPQVNYPYIPNLNDYIDKYLSSEAPILVLIGPPGTGKTRFIKHLLMYGKINKNKSDIIYTSDKSIVEGSELFVDFISGDNDFLVIEDMDLELRDRAEGNKSMYNMLGASDGLVSNIDKKIILSTNLESIAHIDSALLRPGRCYNVLEFRSLTREESREMIATHNRPDINITEKHSLAELYAKLRNEEVVVTKKGAGF